ncbi:MAG: hypothetical protein KJ659_11835 [Actinobacteria bacterium]|nr:hypothetical protein [Actinomycetota bacterium]MBU1607992.1 hypothetical protein [Actinomycetota bacterium]MBU2316168.1 hypothetical protein [Actinomycetota bacterium]MBU2386160.1 hypothetical protein [Actinomycetota bacterium]
MGCDGRVSASIRNARSRISGEYFLFIVFHPYLKNGTKVRPIQDIGISETCVQNWVRKAEVEDGIKPGSTSAENLELREARKRIRLLEQENEVLRRAAAYLSQGAISK